MKRLNTLPWSQWLVNGGAGRYSNSGSRRGEVRDFHTGDSKLRLNGQSLGKLGSSW